MQQCISLTCKSQSLACFCSGSSAVACCSLPINSFDGDILPTHELLKPPPEWKVDLAGWTSRNGKDVGGPRIFAVARALRTSFTKVGAIGFCYGGWAVFQLGAKEHNPGGPGQQNLVDCISAAHPSWLTKEEIANVNVPVQAIAPEIDFAFTTEMRMYFNETIPKLGLPYDLQYFPGVEHAFATRGDEDGPERRSMLRAKRAAVHWFQEWLT